VLIIQEEQKVTLYIPNAVAALHSALAFMLIDFKLKLTPHTHSEIKFPLDFARNSCERLPNNAIHATEIHTMCHILILENSCL